MKEAVKIIGECLVDLDQVILFSYSYVFSISHIFCSWMISQVTGRVKKAILIGLHSEIRNLPCLLAFRFVAGHVFYLFFFLQLLPLFLHLYNFFFFQTLMCTTVLLHRVYNKFMFMQGLSGGVYSTIFVC